MVLTVLLVITVHNRPFEIENLLDSLSCLCLSNLVLDAVLVDDASSPPLRLARQSYPPLRQVILLRSKSNRGPGFCRNWGACALSSEYLWFLDSDTEIINPSCLDAMVAALNDDSSVGAVGGIIENWRGGRCLLELEIAPNYIFLCRPCDAEKTPVKDVDGVATANMVIRRQDFNTVGGFMEGWPCYEDNDICLSLRGRGFRILQGAETAVLHCLSHSGRTTGAFAHFTDPWRYANDIMETRQELIIRHSPRWSPIWPVLDLGCVPFLILGIKRGQYITKRFEMAVPFSSVGRMIPFLIRKYLWCYWHGLGAGVRAWLSKTNATRGMLYAQKHTNS